MSAIYPILIPIPFPVKSANCYYIEDSLPTLIDCGIGSGEALEAIREGVEQTGASLSQIRRILLTHGHVDHMGLAGTIAEMSGAEVFRHPWDRMGALESTAEERVDAKERYRRFFLEGGVDDETSHGLAELIFNRFRALSTPFSGYTPLVGGEVFSFDDFSLRALHTPGHSPGSVCFFNEQDGTLFSGDSLIEEIIVNPAIRPTGPRDGLSHNGAAAYEASLNLIEALPVQGVLPGHGPAFSHPAERVEQLRMHQRARRAAVLQALREHEAAGGDPSPMTPFMLAEALFGTLEGLDIFYGLSMACVHLEFLEEQEFVTRTIHRIAHGYRSTL